MERRQQHPADDYPDDRVGFGDAPRGKSGNCNSESGTRRSTGPQTSDGDTATYLHDNRPSITIIAEEHVVNAQAVHALAADSTIYQRSGLLVRIVRDKSPATRGIRRPLSPRIDALPRALLRERMTAVATWFRIGKNGALEPAHPPGWCVGAVHERAEWPGLRHLEAVIDYPVLRPDGSILYRPGYDPQTGLLGVVRLAAFDGVVEDSRV
jgi:hypothetical protein